jgi:hypothetical protein
VYFPIYDTLSAIASGVYVGAIYAFETGTSSQAEKFETTTAPAAAAVYLPRFDTLFAVATRFDVRGVRGIRIVYISATETSR